MHRLYAMLMKEFFQLRRDKITLILAIMIPVIQLVVFGFAIQTDVKHLTTVVYDQSMSEDSRSLLDSFTATEYFNITSVAHSVKEANDTVVSGKARVAIIIPPDLTANIKHSRVTPIQVLVDSSDTMAASTAIQVASSIGQLTSVKAFLGKTHMTSSTPLNLYDMRIQPLFNRDFITSWYMVPGILGTMLMLTLIVITAISVVREREVGTMEQLLVTPLRTWELLVGKIVPYVIVGFVQMTIAILASVAIFDIPIRGSIFLAYLLTTLYITATLTLGILISTIAKTQIQAVEMSIIVIMPSILLSGFMFPRTSMPDVFIWVSNLLPMTYYLEIMRGIFLRGNGIVDLWMPTLSLLVFTVITFSIAMIRFKRSIGT